MTRLIKLFSLAIFTFTISACHKTDPALKVYFGEWKFSKTEYYWSYNYDQNGNAFEVETETVQWETIGEVSMGTQTGELKINYNKSNSFSFVADTDGANLTCVSGCNNIPYSEDGIAQNGSHTITSKSYFIDLGYYDGSSIQRHWDIKGVKQ